MAYDIHLERRSPEGEPLPIALEAWQAAIETTEGVRLATGDWKITNPKTGAVLSFPNSGGDAEVYFTADAKWLRIFSWSTSSGSASFRGVPDFERENHPVRVVARMLAQKLGAVIRGEGGEIDR